MHAVRRQLVVYERNDRILKCHDRQIPPGRDRVSAFEVQVEQALTTLGRTTQSRSNYGVG
jgi:hypothetical protein